jgi:hypothetical protein
VLYCGCIDLVKALFVGFSFPPSQDFCSIRGQKWPTPEAGDTATGVVVETKEKLMTYLARRARNYWKFKMTLKFWGICFSVELQPP